MLYINVSYYYIMTFLQKKSKGYLKSQFLLWKVEYFNEVVFKHGHNIVNMFFVLKAW